MPDQLLRTFAFLRAINVGGHTVKMGELRRISEALGLQKVETFIASGNLIFETEQTGRELLELALASQFQKELGYAVATFVRTPAELAAVAAFQAFPQSSLDAAESYNVAFLSKAPDVQAQQKLLALKNDIDDFHCSRQEIYWLCKKKQSESKFSNAVLEKTLGQQTTLRGIQTIRKLVAKYAEALPPKEFH
jgi:uncharacterized protein (DUF1697 family)